MTDQQYTPTTTQIKRLFVAVYPCPNPDEAFERWLAERDSEVIVAAEQRGAIKALRDAATAIEKNDIVFDGDHYQPCNSCMSIHMNWLDYRADQMEGDDE